MEQQSKSTTSTLQRPDTVNSAAWPAYWQSLGQNWRTEPEISAQRQQELQAYRARTPDISTSSYPFKDVTLNRADVEWLLATHEDGRGPLSWQTNEQTRVGLDLRAANLSQANLRALPLTRVQAALSLRDGQNATVEQNLAAAANFAKADLTNAHLEGADLSRASFDGAIIIEAHLEGADLGNASLQHAILGGTHLEGAILTRANLQAAILLEIHLEGADIQGAILQQANMLEAHLEGARLRGAHLEGANLLDAHLEGKQMAAGALERIRPWRAFFPSILQATDLRAAFFDGQTNLTNLNLGNEKYGFVSLADVHWNDVNLTVVDWHNVKLLGDEFYLSHQALQPDPALPSPVTPTHPPTELRQQVGIMLRAMEVSDAVISYVFRSPVLMQRLQERLAREKKDQHKAAIQTHLMNYEAALRANRQLAVALQNQGVSEYASYFAYRAQVLQRKVLAQKGGWSIGPLLFSLSLDLLAGYGYRPERTLIAYLLTISGFACAYYLIGQGPGTSLLTAFLLSIVSFHGRGIFPSHVSPSLLITTLGACEAVIGLIIEVSFIATFTQRFLGK